MEKIVEVHFTSKDTLTLHDLHAKNFLENYTKGIVGNNSHFISEGKETVIIHMREVTFIKIKEVEAKND